MPKVSVVLPVYNTKEEYLRECIDSILAQTFTDFELLIINDCSTDENVENVIKSYSDDRIKYYVNEHNLGISGTRNKLIHLASGEYLAVMDHDDISLPERFEKQVAFLDNNPEVGIVGTWYETFPKKKIKKKPEQSEEIENALLWSCPILHSSSMMRKSLNIRYEEKFTPAEDFALYCDLVGKTKFANLQEVLFKYRGHETNASKMQEHKMKLASEAILKRLKAKKPDFWKRGGQNIKVVTKIYLFRIFLLFTISKTKNEIVYSLFGLLPILNKKKNFGELQ